MLLEKSQTFQNDIIFVDGLWGTGKSLIGPIVSGMDRVEKVKIEHIYEHLCIMHHLGKINSDALMWLLKTYADLSQYNNVIGREVNLRWRDESGLANNPNSLKYIKRLFGGDGDQKVADINEQNLALNIMSHMILLVAAPLFEAYGKRLKIVEVLRHPLYMVRHWYAFLQRFDAPRIFTIATQHKEQKVPWFALGWEEEFIQASHMDKVLLSIMRTFERLDQALCDAHTKGHQVLALSFEALAIQPDESLQRPGFPRTSPPSASASNFAQTKNAA